MREATTGGAYGSGLDPNDWMSLRDVIWPYLHADNPAEVEVPYVPDHLRDHEIIRLIRQYRESADKDLLDKEGQLLVPSKEPFGWYVPLTK